MANYERDDRGRIFTTHKGRRVYVNLTVPYFQEYLIIPFGGFLSVDLSCHAMFYAYAIMQTRLKDIQEKLYYEGEKDEVFDNKALMVSTAQLYSAIRIKNEPEVTPDSMWRFIDSVERQMRALKKTIVPRELFTQTAMTRGTNDTIFETNQTSHEVQDHWEEVFKNAPVKRT